MSNVDYLFRNMPTDTTNAVNESAPRLMTFGPFAMTEMGLTKIITRRNGEHEAAVIVSAPFEVISYCRGPDGKSWGILIRFRDPDGRLHTHHVSAAALHGRPSKLAGKLASFGLYVNRARQKELVEYLNAIEGNRQAEYLNAIERDRQ